MLREFLSIKMQRSAPPNQELYQTFEDAPGISDMSEQLCFSASVLFEFQPACIKLIVLSVLSDKLFVVSALDYPSVLKHHDHVGIADRREPVRDNENRSAVHQLIHAVLNKRLSACIYRRGRFIEYHNGRISHRGAGYRDKLTLPLRDFAPLPVSIVLYPSGSLLMKSSARARRAAAYTSSSVASSFP